MNRSILPSRPFLPQRLEGPTSRIRPLLVLSVLLLALGLLAGGVTNLPPAQAHGATVADDGLIEVSTLEQLNAIRWDLDGNGRADDPANSGAYLAAFPTVSCTAQRPCEGYRLTADLDLDTDGDGRTYSETANSKTDEAPAIADSGDVYYNGGAGWEPIGSAAAPYNAIFEGDNHTISNLVILRGPADYVGLFGVVGEDGLVARTRLDNVAVWGNFYVGALTGQLNGTARGVSSHGWIEALDVAGGLVGRNAGFLTHAYSNATVFAEVDAGGLVGENAGEISVAYATGTVSGDLSVGGLVGLNTGQLIATYTAGVVYGWIDAGGLVGLNTARAGSSGRITSSLAAGPVLGEWRVGGLVGRDTAGPDSVSQGYYHYDHYAAALAMRFATEGENIGRPARLLGGAQGLPTYPDGKLASLTADPLDVDGDGENDRVWLLKEGRFPALLADFNGDGQATMLEFGQQLRLPPVLGFDPAHETDPPSRPVRLDWSEPAVPAEWGVGTVEYQLHRVTFGFPYGEPIREPVTRRHQQDTDVDLYRSAAWYVEVLLDGVGVGSSNLVVAAIVTDYDRDDDGLIDITNLAQLNAIRWDRDGDGAVATGNRDAYAYAFPWAVRGMGCPADGCVGYELLNDLDFDTGTVGDRTDDDYHHGGEGWEPIGKDNPPNNSVRYNAVFEGNRHSLANLYINRGGANDVGLFGALGTAGQIRNLDVVDASVMGQQYVGALAGKSYGSIERSYVAGAVSGSSMEVGGLAGLSNGPVSSSYAVAAVSGVGSIGGLIGHNGSDGTIVASYAVGPVTGAGAGRNVGGLAGYNENRIIASYATGPVFGSAGIGSLLGRNDGGTVIASYATGPVFGTEATDVGGLVGANFQGAFTDNYCDSATTGRTFGLGQDDNDDTIDNNPTDHNNVLDPGETMTAGITCLATFHLYYPDAYAGKYANWRNLDLDGDASTVETNDFWDFGNLYEYPTLKADFNGDGRATWQEFGFQLRQSPDLTLTPDADGSGASLSWIRWHGSNHHWRPRPAETFQVYKNGVALGNPVFGRFLNARDPSFTLEGDWNTLYWVGALLDGVYARSSNIVMRNPPTAIDLSLDPDRVSENGGTTTVTVTVAYRGGWALATPTTVSVTVTGGTATAGTDYATINSVTDITIPAGQNSGATTFDIAPTDDADSEGNETITVTGTAAGGLTGTATATLTLVDDEPPPVPVSFSLTPDTIDEVGSSNSATLTATISRAVTAATTINVSASPASAVTLSGATLTIPAHQTASAGSGITVTAVDNSRDSADATVTLSGTVPQSGIIAPASVTLTIIDDDPLPTLSLNSPSMPEGDNHTRVMRFTFTLSPASGRTVTVDYVNDVDASTAHLGPDFPDYVLYLSADTLTFQPGQTRESIPVYVVGDRRVEEDETVVLSLSSLVNAEFGDGFSGTGATRTAIGTIVNDDAIAQPAQAEPGSVSVDPTNLLIREGNPAQTYTLVLDVEPTGNVTVAVSSDNGDVTVQPASLTFTPDNWQTAQTVTVSVAHDGDKADERAVISHRASGGNYDTITAPTVTVSVTDDDSDREILRDFYNATGGANWSNKDGWLSNRPLNQWHGVTVNGQGQVTHLQLRINNLSGSLPAALGKLEALQVISLDRNGISGSLPAELGNLSNLTRLAMNRNSLTGSIPSELGNLTNLSIIGLARNGLSGALPTSLGNLSVLTRLSLHDNTELSGALPSGFVNLANLHRLAIANTALCAPDTDDFREWLDTVPDKPGGVPTCE